MTGEQMVAKIFIAPIYYYRLKHIVEDKIHARARGNYVSLTRAPTDGRGSGGGLRVGEMERDCLLAHGVVGFLKERFFECSDHFFVYVCEECGAIAVVNPRANIYKCGYCPNMTMFSQVRIPYTCKLFFQEIMAMGIMVRMTTTTF